VVAEVGRRTGPVDVASPRPDPAHEVPAHAGFVHAEVTHTGSHDAGPHDAGHFDTTDVGADRKPVRRPGWSTAAAVLRWTLVAVAAGAVAVTFAPWLRTGTATRTSYEVVRAADRLGVLSPGSQAVVSVAWSFLPLVAALAVLALVCDRVRLAAGLAATVGLVEVFLASAINNAPRSADWGAPAGLVLGSALVVVALATAWTTRSSR